MTTRSERLGRGSPLAGDLPTDRLRDAQGARFRKHPKCDACGKPVTAFFTDNRICGGTDGPGFYLCDRRKCAENREQIENYAGLVGLKHLYEYWRAISTGELVDHDSNKQLWGFAGEAWNPITSEETIIFDCRKNPNIVENYKEEGGRYQVVCNAHGSIVHTPSLQDAKLTMMDPLSFCEDCREQLYAEQAEMSKA